MKKMIIKRQKFIKKNCKSKKNKEMILKKILMKRKKKIKQDKNKKKKIFYQILILIK